MKILCVGGGSGGHITPIAAVIERLKSPKYRHRVSDLEVRVWCDKKFANQARSLLSNDVRVDVIPAGKLRRYANLNFWYRLFSPWHIIHTHIPNFIDLFKIMGGFIWSAVKLLLWRPDVVFCKGGFVSLPVGLMAHWYRIPLVIHDSDTVPGLTNRVLAKYATQIGTGSPVKNYPSYPKSRTSFIGIPVSPEAKRVSSKQRAELKAQLGLDIHRPLILAMGGGLGAVAINQAIVDNAKKLVKAGGQIVLLTGRGHQVQAPTGTKVNFHIYDFSNQTIAYEQAADVVVTRAGATTMAELAAIGSATIIVPSPYLAGDHQTKNAEVYAQAKAGLMVNEFDLEQNPELLGQAINKILSDNQLRGELSDNLHDFARPNALDDMTDMILTVVR